MVGGRSPNFFTLRIIGAILSVEVQGVENCWRRRYAYYKVEFRFIASIFQALLFFVFSDLKSGFFEDQNFLFPPCIQSDLIVRNTCHPFTKGEVTLYEISSADGDYVFALNIENCLQYQVLLLFFRGIFLRENARWKFKGIHTWLIAIRSRSTFQCDESK